jgi:hypothetical protein
MVTVELLRILSRVNSLMRDVALDHPEYQSRCSELSRRLEKELKEIVKEENLISELIIKQLGNERNN